MSAGRSFWDAIRDLPGSQDQLGRLLEEAPFGVYVDDPTRGCIYANKALLRHFGVSWENFQGFGWAHFIVEDDAQRLRERIRVYETELEPIHVSYRVRGEDDAQRWVHARVEPILDAEGRHVGSIGITQDRTAEQEFESRAARSQKLEAIGRLSARVAHDFNNLLTPMLFALETLEQEPGGASYQEAVQSLRRATDHARQLTGQLLTLSRQRVSSRSWCAFDAEIRKLIPLLKTVLGEGIQIQEDLAAGDAVASLDAGHLGQILLNLATNGTDAMQGYGVLEIRSSADRSRVRLEVEDHGTGMSAETVGKALEPFFTTKEAGRGTGLGLATVDDLLTLAGGSIELDSKPGRGTVARIEVPVADASAIGGAAEEPRVLPSGRGLVVLLVEDQDALRQSLAYSLALQGFSVLGARSLGEARERLDENPEPDLLVSDVMLPDGTAPGLVDELRRRRPDLPVLYISGFAGEDSQVLVEDRQTAFLEKPFGLAKFLSTLAGLLSKREPPSS